MSLPDLYSEIILEHYKHPHNVGKLDPAAAFHKGFNESCGDDIRVYVNIEGDVITDIRFEGKGCAISQSSASMMTGSLTGKTIAEALAQIEEFKHMIAGEKQFPESDEYFELSALKGVIRFPVRVKCATLSWNTIKGALTTYQAAQLNGTGGAE